jgi:muconate cycloisomerase
MSDKIPMGEKSKPCQITHVEILPVSMGLRAVHSQSLGDVGGTTTSIFLKLTASSGVVGWGEAAPWAPVTGSAKASFDALSNYFKPILLGADSFAIRGLLKSCSRSLANSAAALAAVEMALLDIIGQELRASISVLLGGRVRSEIPLSFSIANPDFAADLDFVTELLADGVRLFKVKTGFLDHKTDIIRLEKLRAVLPDDAEIRVDYNQALHPHDALRKLRDIDDFGLGFIEQPVSHDRVDVLARLTAALDTPIMADEALISPADAIHLVKMQAVSAFSVKAMKAGGIYSTQEICSVAAASGIACYAGSMLESGVASTAGAHLAATTQSISLGCEYYQPTYYLSDDVLAIPFGVKGGRVQVPTTPGLGIIVDEDKLRSMMID